MKNDFGERNLHSKPCADVSSEDLPECATHSFIVKLWLEETEEEAGQAVWRGHVTHVPTHERRYLNQLNEVVAFISPFLRGKGGHLSIYKRMWAWVNKFW